MSVFFGSKQKSCTRKLAAASAMGTESGVRQREPSKRERVPMSFFEDGICRAYENEPTRAMNIECLMLLDGPLDSSAFRGIPAIPCWHMSWCCGARTGRLGGARDPFESGANSRTAQKRTPLRNTYAQACKCPRSLARVDKEENARVCVRA